MEKDQLDDQEQNGPLNNNDLGWNCLGLHPCEVIKMMEDRKVLRFNLEFLPLQPSRKSGQKIETVTKREKECSVNTSVSVKLFSLSYKVHLVK